MPIIRPLELTDSFLVKSCLRQYPPEVSELTFTNLFAWRGSRPIWLAEVEESVVFIADIQEGESAMKVILGCPLGRASPLSVVQSIGIELQGFVRLAQDTADTLRAAGLYVSDDRDNSDYVYSVSDLAGLKGRRFHKKRNLIKQCLASYTCEYEQMTPKLIFECVEMQDRWCEARQCGKDPGLCNEYAAIRETFAHYDKLNLFGGAIRVEGKIQAYAIGEELSPGTAVCHFEKSMPGIRGLAQLMNQWFAMYALNAYTFVNREQDLGIPGLRQAKESYYPHHMVNKFNAWFKDVGLMRPELVDPRECDKHLPPSV